MLRSLMVTPVVLTMGALSLTSCGDEYSGLVQSGVLESDDHVSQPYDGPLYIEPKKGESKSLVARTGAAGRIVQCETPVTGGFQPGVYAEGATADSLAGAFDVAMSERIYDGAFNGYRIARDEGNRVLFVFSADGSVRQALIMHDGPATEGAGGPGWYVESWARCDLSEFPDEVAEQNWGTQIWTDSDGSRMATSIIVSYPGPEHCNWQASTFLYLDDEQVTYVRKPPKELMAEYFDEPFRADIPLPPDAVDTGFERRGTHLWLSPDGKRAYVGTSASVELWPRPVEGLACA